MEDRKQQIDHFFNHYCEIFNCAIKEEIPGVEQTAELFSTCFISANPQGVNCGQNNEIFRDVMLNGYAFYRNIGITSMEIISKDIMILDDFHTMAKVAWKSIFKKEGKTKSIEFRNIYFTQTKDSQHKVFAYITGDEQRSLREAGLVQ
jgi:hypothetical protein